MLVPVVVSHRRKVLRAGKDDVLTVAYEIVGAFIDAVQGIVGFVEAFLAVDELADVLPVIKVFGSCQDQVAVAGEIFAFEANHLQ